MAALPTLSRAPAAAAGRLRERLVAAGPVAARFGIHLGSRVDLFSGADCLRLLEIPDSAPPSRPELVAVLIERQLGARPDELFEAFEPEPFDSGLLGQRHRARLAGGEPVTVEVAHPELETALADGRLAALADRLIEAGELPAAARAAVAEYLPRLDFLHAAGALEELAEETADSRWVAAARVQRRLCAPCVRVVTAPGATEAGSPAAAGEGRARRLARLWLAMALGGDLFPLEPWGRSIAHAADGRVAFVDGAVHRLPRAALTGLREYLAAVAARRPARAALAFLDLLPEGRADRRLRDRLRHIDPFRDRGWDVGGDLFARQVLAHWRAAGELGYPLAEDLAPFYRGLFLLNQETRRLAGDTSAVRDGLREARLLLVVGELGEGVGEGRWAGAVERQMALLTGLPAKLDRILTLAAGEERPETAETGPAAGREPGRGGAWAALAACLLALTAVVALTHHAAGAAGFGAAAERLGALVVLLLGGLALRVAARSGDP